MARLHIRTMADSTMPFGAVVIALATMGDGELRSTKRWTIGPWSVNLDEGGYLQRAASPDSTLLESDAFWKAHEGQYILLDSTWAHGEPEVCKIVGTSSFSPHDGAHVFLADVERGLWGSTARAHPAGTRFDWTRPNDRSGS